MSETNKKILEYLDEIKMNIELDSYTQEYKEDILNTLDELLNGVKKPDPNIITYLFRGWWLTEYFNNGIRTGTELPTGGGGCLSEGETDDQTESNSV